MEVGAAPAIRSGGARLLFLPKYSPDLNPIEQFFAKLKRCLYKAVRRMLGQTLDTVTSAECYNYFVDAGYEPT
jgi:transposase